MCFSAPASFIASGGLLLLGAGTYALARKKDKILVAIPLLFGLQQAFEGVQWLYLNKGSSSLPAAYDFLLFALIVWPVYVPAFVYALDKERRKILKWFVFIGAAVSLYFTALLIMEPLYVRIRHSCVYYGFDFPGRPVVLTAYLLAVIGALFASHRPIFRWFGAAISLLAGASWWIFTVNFVSVWCFFSAAVSAMFFLYVQRKRRLKRLAFLTAPPA